MVIAEIASPVGIDPLSDRLTAVLQHEEIASGSNTLAHSSVSLPMQKFGPKRLIAWVPAQRRYKHDYKIPLLCFHA
jgi:hypothetical protein